MKQRADGVLHGWHRRLRREPRAVKPGLGGDREDRPFRRHPHRVLQRPGEERRGVHHRRRQAVRDARRLRHRRGRRVGDPSGPGLDLHQLGRREDLPRRGRVRRAVPPRRHGRHRRGRPRRAIRPAGGGHRRAPDRTNRPVARSRPGALSATTSPDTRCLGSSTWWTRSSARRAASPITSGPTPSSRRRRR